MYLVLKKCPYTVLLIFFILCRLCFLCYYYFLCHSFYLLSSIFGLHQHISKYSHMVGKSPTWSENYCGWKATNSDMVGKSPTWLENYCGYKGETTENIPIWLEKVWHGRKITVDGWRQILTWWEISLRGWEKVFRHIGHLVWSIHRIGGNFPSSFLSVQDTSNLW